MSNRDLYHFAVKRALQKIGWVITADPLTLEFDDVLVKIDLAAERLIAAERDGEKIAIEIKSFAGDSAVSEFHTALGQCLDYQIMLEMNEPDRALYLAIPIDIYETFFQTRFARIVLGRYPLSLVIYAPTLEEILDGYLSKLSPLCTGIAGAACGSGANERGGGKSNFDGYGTRPLSVDAGRLE